MTAINLAESARLATIDDVEAIVELVGEARASIADVRGGNLWLNREARQLPADESITLAVQSPDQLLVVGELDAIAVGYAAAHLETLADHSLLAVVDDLFVLPDGREVGVGEEIMSLLLQWATDQGCRGIDAAALPGDRHTKNFFESNGLVARAILVHKSLTP